MGRNRVVIPQVKRIPISDGDWIEVRRELNVGEQRRLESCGLKPPVMLNGRPFSPVDWAIHDLERAMIFLVAWSLQDGQEPPQPLPLHYASVAALDVDSFEEINQAIVTHVLEEAAAKKSRREAEKKAKEEALKAETQPAQPATNGNPPAQIASDPTYSSVNGQAGVGIS